MELFIGFFYQIRWTIFMIIERCALCRMNTPFEIAHAIFKNQVKNQYCTFKLINFRNLTFSCLLFLHSWWAHMLVLSHLYNLCATKLCLGDSQVGSVSQDFRLTLLCIFRKILKRGNIFSQNILKYSNSFLKLSAKLDWF